MVMMKSLSPWRINFSNHMPNKSNKALKRRDIKHMGFGEKRNRIMSLMALEDNDSPLEVRVADVDWLKIMSGDEISLMEGSMESIDILAGVNDGNTFESSQYAYMSIFVHIEDQIAELVDGDNLSGLGGEYISTSSTIYGRCAGVTTLYVTARQQTGVEIYSQTVKVEVYTPPVLHPCDIFLVPGATYVLAAKGGPKIGVTVECTSMNNSSVAVQESSGQVSAISPGNATIVATFYGNGGSILCQAHGRVIVGVPSAAVLNVQSGQLAVGREMPIFPFLLEGDLFSFYELCKNYKWAIENEKVLSFHPNEHMNNDNYKPPISGQIGFADEQDVNFIKVLHGRTAGRSSVAVTFSCEFRSHSSLSHSRTYSALLSIRVVPELPLAQGIPVTWILPPDYTTTDRLPASSGSHSRRDIQNQTGAIAYSLLGHCGRLDAELQKGIISIHGNKVKTTDRNSLACIQAKDLSTGRIEVAACIRVAEVTQIRIGRKFPLHVIHLVVGAELEIPINFYGNLGNPFLEAYGVVVFDLETNHRDILALDVSRKNGTMIVKAKRHGRALVGVSVDDPVKSDYIMVSVGAHIHPQNPVLHPGSRLNFSLEALTSLELLVGV